MTVILALLANILVAVAKSIASIITGSAAMLAEAAHSWADAGNEIFLLLGDRSSRRPRDDRHPLGYGRDTWIWSLFAAIGVFTVGATVSVLHGIQELFEPERSVSPIINYAVLGVSLVLEGISFAQSVRQARKTAREREVDVIDFIAGTPESTLRAVFAEDGAAIIGVFIAALGIFLHQVTGIAQFDAAASILIGLLLAGVALFLISRNRALLIGGAAPQRLRDEILRLLEAESTVDHVTYLHVEFTGPQQLFVVGAVDIVGDRPEHQVADLLREIEDRLEAHDRVQTAVLTVASYLEPSVSDDPEDAVVDEA